MADFNFPGIDLSDPFLPPSSSISIYNPFKHNTPKLAMKPPHDYGTFTYPVTPEDELPRPLSLPSRSRNFSLNSAPSLSFSRSSSTSSKSSSSSSTFNISSNRSSTPKWKPLTSFPYFTSLPLEIQRTIWKHTLPGAQILEIHQHAPSTTHSSSSIPNSNQQSQESLPILKTHTTLPIALQINHLSRHLALSHLTPLSFAQPYYLPSNPYAYINYTHDTIYLSTQTLYPDLCKHILYSRNLHKIRYLAVEFNVWSKLLGDNYFINVILEMDGLLRIDIIFERDFRGVSSYSHNLINFSHNDASSSSPIKSTNKTNHRYSIKFLNPTKQEQKTLEDILSKESEKIWLWGHVSGWDDVRGKISCKWKEEGRYQNQNQNQKPKYNTAAQNHNGMASNSRTRFLENNGNLSFENSYPHAYPYSESKSKSRSSSPSPSSPTKPPQPPIKNSQRRPTTITTNMQETLLQKELQNLILSLDNAMLDFEEDVGLAGSGNLGGGRRGGGEEEGGGGEEEGGGGEGGVCECDYEYFTDVVKDGLVKDGDGARDMYRGMYRDADMYTDADVYSESEYSQCSGSLDDEDEDCEDDDDDDDDDGMGGWI